MFQIIWKETHIDFMGKRFIAFTLSGLLVLAGIFAFIQILLSHANLGIEFVGGTGMQISFSKSVPLDQARDAISKIGIAGAELQDVTSKDPNKTSIFVRVKKDNTPERITDALRKLDDQLKVNSGDLKPNSSESIGLTINMQICFSKSVPLDQSRDAISKIGIAGAELQEIVSQDKLCTTSISVAVETIEKRITDALKKLDDKLTIDSSESIGASIGKELRDKAILAIIFATLGLLIYIAVRFDYKFGIAAALATFHDVLAVLGVAYLMGMEITLFIITALLTLAGYSLTDTVVVFDRIRENLRKNPRTPFMDLLNASINQVLSRTIITSLTVLLVLVALFFFGGPVLHDFSFALGFGVIVGTYSSIFVASPLLLMWRGSGRGKLIGQVKREQPTAAATSKS